LSTSAALRPNEHRPTPDAVAYFGGVRFTGLHQLTMNTGTRGVGSHAAPGDTWVGLHAPGTRPSLWGPTLGSGACPAPTMQLIILNRSIPDNAYISTAQQELRLVAPVARAPRAGVVVVSSHRRRRPAHGKAARRRAAVLGS